MSEFPLLSGPELGRLLGITGRTVLRLHANGVLPREGKRYDAFACVPAYITYVKHNSEASGDLAAAKLRLTDAQRQAIERKNAVAERRVIHVADVEQTLERVGVLIGGQLDGLGGRLAGDLATMSDPALIRRTIFDECRRIRNAMAGELEALAGAKANGKDAAGATVEESRHVG